VRFGRSFEVKHIFESEIESFDEVNVSVAVFGYEFPSLNGFAVGLIDGPMTETPNGVVSGGDMCISLTFERLRNLWPNLRQSNDGERRHTHYGEQDAASHRPSNR